MAGGNRQAWKIEVSGDGPHKVKALLNQGPPTVPCRSDDLAPLADRSTCLGLDSPGPGLKLVTFLCLQPGQTDRQPTKAVANYQKNKHQPGPSGTG